MLVVAYCRDPWEGYIAFLERQCEQEQQERELELDHEREREIEALKQWYGVYWREHDVDFGPVPIEEADVEYIDLALAEDLALVTNDLAPPPGIAPGS